MDKCMCVCACVGVRLEGLGAVNIGMCGEGGGWSVYM